MESLHNDSALTMRRVAFSLTGGSTQPGCTNPGQCVHTCRHEMAEGWRVRALQSRTPPTPHAVPLMHKTCVHTVRTLNCNCSCCSFFLLCECCFCRLRGLSQASPLLSFHRTSSASVQRMKFLNLGSKDVRRRAANSR